MFHEAPLDDVSFGRYAWRNSGHRFWGVALVPAVSVVTCAGADAASSPLQHKYHNVQQNPTRL
jgi:hypothetical protein